jgi:hypothetical protein
MSDSNNRAFYCHSALQVATTTVGALQTVADVENLNQILDDAIAFAFAVNVSAVSAEQLMKAHKLAKDCQEEDVFSIKHILETQFKALAGMPPYYAHRLVHGGTQVVKLLSNGQLSAYYIYDSFEGAQTACNGLNANNVPQALL